MINAFGLQNVVKINITQLTFETQNTMVVKHKDFNASMGISD